MPAGIISATLVFVPSFRSRRPRDAAETNVAAEAMLAQKAALKEFAILIQYNALPGEAIGRVERSEFHDAFVGRVPVELARRLRREQ